MDIHIYPHSIEYLCHCLPVRAARRKERGFIDLKTSLTHFFALALFLSLFQGSVLGVQGREGNCIHVKHFHAR
jgi:hypothetical protein